MAVGDIYRANILQAMKGNRVISGMHFRALTTSASQGDLAQDIVDNVLPTWIAAITTDVGVVAVEVQDVIPGTHETIDHTITGNLVGEMLPPSTPPQVAAVISIHTGQKSKRKRGRFYIAGLTAILAGAGTISGLQLTRLQELADMLKNRFTLGGTSRNLSYEMVVYSPADPDFVNKKGEHTRLATVITGVTTLTVDATTRSQRRRELGVGA